MSSTRRGFLKLLGIGVGATAIVTAASPSLGFGKASVGGVEIVHDRHRKRPAAWVCRGVTHDGRQTFAMSIDYTDDDLRRLGERSVIDAATAFVVSQLTGPERDFFKVSGMQIPEHRQRWINPDGSLDWRQLCPECMERMDSWRGLCRACKAAADA